MLYYINYSFLKFWVAFIKIVLWQIYIYSILITVLHPILSKLFNYICHTPLPAGPVTPFISFVTIIFIYWSWGWCLIHATTCMWKPENNFTGFNSLLPSCWSLKLNSGHQLLVASTLLSHLSGSSCICFVMICWA